MSTLNVDPVLARASDPTTSPHELDRLARHRRRDVRSAVVANPNTDPVTLGALAAAFPESFLANPILDWLLLEDPNWLGRLAPPARAAILRRPGLDDRLVWWALRSGETEDQLALLMNQSLAPGIVAEMTRAYDDSSEDQDSNDDLGNEEAAIDPDIVAPSSEIETGSLLPGVIGPESQGEDLDLSDDVRQAAALHVAAPSEDDADQPVSGHRTPAEVIDAIHEGIAHTPSETVELFSLGLLPDWLIPAMTIGDSTEVRLGLAHSAKTPTDTLTTLLFDDDESVRLAASANPALPYEAAAFFEKVTNKDVAVTSEQLRTLTKSGFGLRLASAHPNAERAYIADSIVSNSWKIREAVASSPLLEHNDWYLLACDADRDVRAAVAANPTVPEPIRGLLLLDDDILVAAAAQRVSEDTDEQADNQPSARERADSATSPSNPGAPTNPISTADHLHPAAALTPTEIDRLIDQGEFGRAMVARLRHLDPEVLRRFAHDSAWRVRQSAAANPSTPDDVLRSLAGDADVDVREAVANRQAIPDDVLETLTSDVRSTVRVILARRDLPIYLPVFATDQESDVRLRVAENPRTGDDLIGKLATDEEQRVRLAIATRPHLPNEARPGLATDDAQEVRCAFLQRADLSPQDHVNLLGPDQSALAPSLGRLLSGEKIAPHEETDLVATLEWAHIPLAKLPSISTVGLTAMSTSISWRVREAVAHHPNTSVELLEKLSADLDYDVRTAVAENPNTPSQLLERFLTDAMGRVRQGLANRSDLHSEALEQLALDAEAEVRKAARSNPNLGTQASELIRALEDGLPLSQADFDRFSNSTGVVQVAAAAHPQAPDSLLRSLHLSTDWSVRRSVASNPNCPSDVLSALINDSDKDVRCAVASNPNTPSSSVAILLGDGVDEVRQTALRATTLSDHDRAVFAKKTATRMARSGAELSRIVAYSSPLLNDLELRRRRGWQSPNWLVRYAIAANPACPAGVLQELGSDGNRIVRQTAKVHMAERESQQ